ncbi:MAG: alpha/beta fold hydrolase [Acidimicrobiia bacterium]
MRRLPKLVGRVALGWFLWRILGPETPPRYERGQSRPLRVPGRTVFVGDRELFVREAGPADGPPLVLVHGWSFDGEMTFHQIIPLLADRYRVIVPDHRNHGHSDWVRGRFEIADLADDLAGVLDVCGVHAATVFGWSMGGMVVQELARRRPDLVGRMVLGATAARPIAHGRGLARAAFWAGRSIARVSRFEMATLVSRALSRSGALDAVHHRWMRSALLHRDPTLYYEAGVAVWRFDARQWVRSLRVPALVIVPGDDQMVPPRAQHDLASLLPGADVAELRGARHESIINRASEIAGLVRGFAT